MNSANAVASIDATDQLVDVDRAGRVFIGVRSSGQRDGETLPRPDYLGRDNNRNLASSLLAMGVRPKARSSLLS